MNYATAEDLVAFEARIASLFNTGALPFLIHLSGGNEAQLVEIFREVKDEDWVFSGHRSHSHYLLKGGNADHLEALIEDGRSMFVFDRERNFYTSSVLGGTAGIAAGVAWRLKEEGSAAKVWCFLGDGAADEAHFWEAVWFVEGHGLPCVFVVEDNNRSVDTDRKTRRGHKDAMNRVLDSLKCVHRYDYVPTYPHGGRGPGPQVTFLPEVVAKFTNPA